MAIDWINLYWRSNLYSKRTLIAAMAPFNFWLLRHLWIKLSNYYAKMCSRLTSLFLKKNLMERV